MIKAILLTVIIIIGAGCLSNNTIELNSIVGEYYGIENYEDYNHLELRDDKTFRFDQSKMFSCNVWRHFYGHFKIKKDKLRLYKGVDLDTLIQVNSTKGTDSDTLRIRFNESFLREFPDLKARIGYDSIDTQIQNGVIVFDKDSYCIKEKIFVKSVGDKVSTYESYPLELNLRAGAYYHTSQYILNKGEMTFALGSFMRIQLKENLLVEYKLVNGILKSTKCNNWINSNKLIKEKQK